MSVLFNQRRPSGYHCVTEWRHLPDLKASPFQPKMLLPSVVLSFQYDRLPCTLISIKEGKMCVHLLRFLNQLIYFQLLVQVNINNIFALTSRVKRASVFR